MDSVGRLFSSWCPIIAMARDSLRVVSIDNAFAHGLSIDSHNTAPDDWVFLLPRSTPSHAVDDNKTRIRLPQQHPEVLVAGLRTRSAH